MKNCIELAAKLQFAYGFLNPTTLWLKINCQNIFFKASFILIQKFLAWSSLLFQFRFFEYSTMKCDV